VSCPFSTPSLGCGFGEEAVSPGPPLLPASCGDDPFPPSQKGCGLRSGLPDSSQVLLMSVWARTLGHGPGLPRSRPPALLCSHGLRAAHRWPRLCPAPP
jgi:hypothetical protein